MQNAGMWNSEAPMRDISHPDTIPARSHLSLLPEIRRIVHQLCCVRHTSIAILSQFPRDGRSLITSTLATAAARLAGRNVLIISASPHTSQPCYEPSSSSEETAPGTIKVIPAQVSGGCHGDYIPSPSKTSSDDTISLNSEFALGEYLQSARDLHDLILLDCAPLSALQNEAPHPAVVASLADSALLVLSPKGLKRTALCSLKQTLRFYAIKPIGFIYNAGEAV